MDENSRPIEKHHSLGSLQQPANDMPTESIQNIKKALTGFLAARLELVGLETKEAIGFAGKKLVYLILLGISVFFIWCLVLAGLAGVLAPIADQWLDDKTPWLPGWCAALFALGLLHAFVALVCIILLKRKPSAELFALSKQELENDKQWLRKNK